MTVPFMLDSLSVMLIGMLITALISSNGQSSMAAVALVGPVTNLVVCMFNGIGAGGTVIVAQCCGTGDQQRTARACAQVIWLTVIIGVASCLPLLIFPDAVLLALYPDAEAEVLRKASIYLTGSTWSILAFVVYTAMYSVLRGLGESQKCLILSVIINAAYLIFSIVFLNECSEAGYSGQRLRPDSGAHSRCAVRDCAAVFHTSADLHAAKAAFLL